MGPIRTLLAFSLLLFAAPAGAQDVQPLLGQPLRALDAAQLDVFLQGRVAFETPLAEREGLGPIFNEPACASCHNHPATGGAGTRAVTRFGKAGPPFDPLAALGGSLLQDQAIDVQCLETVPPRADVTAQRLTPICFGAGLLETIVDADILANTANGGVVSMVGDLEDPNRPLRPARFGWKGVVANTVTFSIDASLNEMGLTSVFLPTENAPNGDQNKLAQCDAVADPEDGPDAGGKTRIERFTEFQRFLAAPPQTPRSGMTGEALFVQVGCASCHVPAYVTGSAPEAVLTGQSIRPYSDFLLHDMGALGDGIAQGNAAETVMMTRALWGVAQRISLMHDGRVTGGTFHDNMLACVQAHEGEGATSRAAFNALPAADQDRVVDFLGSLGRAEFDQDTDNDLDEFDWFFIEPFLTGPVPSYTADSPEAFCDADQDGDFDLVDFGIFQRGFTGQVDPPELPAPPASADLKLSVRAGTSHVFVAPGGLVRYQVVGELTDPDNQGLAMFDFDLAFDGGPLPAADPPLGWPMDRFAADLGLANPGGFGGTPTGGDLIGVGGAQNTILNSFAPRPVGDVVTGVARRGSPQDLVEGSFVAPTTAGTYNLTLSGLHANALTQDTDGDPFWKVAEVQAGKQTDLEVHVADCAPRIYCTGKQTSQGCVAEMGWKGLPTLNGPNDFRLLARHLVPGQVGIFIWSLAPDSKPFFGGTLCLSGKIVRTPVAGSGASSADCGGLLQFQFGQGYMANRGLTVGTKVYAQAWFRDPAHPDGTGIGLSDAIEFEICP